MQGGAAVARWSVLFYTYRAHGRGAPLNKPFISQCQLFAFMGVCSKVKNTKNKTANRKTTKREKGPLRWVEALTKTLEKRKSIGKSLGNSVVFLRKTGKIAEFPVYNKRQYRKMAFYLVGNDALVVYRKIIAAQALKNGLKQIGKTGNGFCA